MLIARCAWHRIYFGHRKWMRVVSWWPLWSISFTDGLCSRCRTRVLTEGLVTRLQRASTRLRTDGWYTGRDDRQEIAHDIDTVIGRLERLAR